MRSERYLTRRVFVKRALALISALSFPALSRANATHIRFYHGDNFPPLAYLFEGEMHGLIVEIVNLIFSRIENSAVSHHGYTWKRSQNYVRTGKGHGVFTVRTEERQEHLYFNEKVLLTNPVAIITGKQNKKAREILAIKKKSELQKFTMGAVSGSGFAKSHFAESNDIVWFSDFPSLIKTLAAGRIDCYVGPWFGTWYRIKQSKLEDSLLWNKVPFVSEIEYRIGLRQDYPEVKRILKEVDVIAARDDFQSELQLLIKRYTDDIQME